MDRNSKTRLRDKKIWKNGQGCSLFLEEGRHTVALGWEVLSRDPGWTYLDKRAESPRLRAGCWGPGDKGGLRRGCGQGCGTEIWMPASCVGLGRAGKVLLSVLFWFFFQQQDLLMQLSCASFPPLFMNFYSNRLHCSYRLWNQSYISCRLAPAWGWKEGERRKALFYLDFTHVSEMNFLIRFSLLGLSYSLILREYEYHKPKRQQVTYIFPCTQVICMAIDWS